MEEELDRVKRIIYEARHGSGTTYPVAEPYISTTTIESYNPRIATVTSGKDHVLGDLLSHLFDNNYDFCKVGSGSIKEVLEPQDKDVLIKGDEKLVKELQSKGWVLDGSDPHPAEDGRFKSLKRWAPTKPVNAIIYFKPDDYHKFIEANDICISSRLVHKEDRVKVFGYVFGEDHKYEAISTEEFSNLIVKNHGKSSEDLRKEQEDYLNMAPF